MNKKGFTLVELITTFALSIVIITILVNVLLILKETYNKSEIKTKLLIEQGNLSRTLNSSLKDGDLTTYEECSDSEFCYEFKFIDGETVKLVITDKTIKFGDYTQKINSNSYIETPTITPIYVNNLNNELTLSFLTIKIPIKCKLYKDYDFGVNVVYRF